MTPDQFPHPPVADPTLRGGRPTIVHPTSFSRKLKMAAQIDDFAADILRREYVQGPVFHIQ